MPGKDDIGFQLWAKKGLEKIQALYTENVLMTLGELSHKYNLPKNHFFKFLQIRKFISSKQHSSVKPELTSLEKLTIKNCNFRFNLITV